MGSIFGASMVTLPLDAFIPHPDVRERFEITIEAPAALVMDVAANFDMQSPPMVRAVFWLRERFMGASRVSRRKPQGLLAETQALGWSLLCESPGRLIVCGAACQPWLADVKFIPVSADRFGTYSVPNHVKIAWSLEAEEVAPSTTRFAQETRVVATDAEAKMRFQAYWRWARFGIVSIRLLLLPAIRRVAERRWKRGAAERLGKSS